MENDEKELDLRTAARAKETAKAFDIVIEGKISLDDFFSSFNKPHFVGRRPSVEHIFTVFSSANKHIKRQLLYCLFYPHEREIVIKEMTNV
jgi:hypothetical protein